MRIAAIGALAAISIAFAGQADATILGGIAGHYAGHGVVGAVGGCMAGRALAKRADRKGADRR